MYLPVRLCIMVHITADRQHRLKPICFQLCGLATPVVSTRAHLDALVQTLEGVDVQSFLAGLQTGDDFLAFDGARSDGQS